MSIENNWSGFFISLLSHKNKICLKNNIIFHVELIVL